MSNKIFNRAMLGVVTALLVGPLSCLAWETASTTDLLGSAIDTSGSMIFAVVLKLLPYVVGVLAFVVGWHVIKRWTRRASRI